MPFNAEWLSSRGGALSASSTAITQPAQHQRRLQATASAAVLGAESDVAHSTDRAGSAVAERSDRAITDDVQPATLHSAAEPDREPSDPVSLDEASNGVQHSSDGGSGAGAPSAGGGGRRAGAFQRLPMVQLAKEQLSSAQRAARRVPYSRKLKNEAQRERNRHGF